MVLFTGVFFGWFWSIAIGLQKNIPEEIKMKVNRFKVFFFIPLIYIILLMVYMGGIFSGMGNSGFTNSGWIVAIILPLHLFSMFCIFIHCTLFRKQLKPLNYKEKSGLEILLGNFSCCGFISLESGLFNQKSINFTKKKTLQPTKPKRNADFSLKSVGGKLNTWLIFHWVRILMAILSGIYAMNTWKSVIENK